MPLAGAGDAGRMNSGAAGGPQLVAQLGTRGSDGSQLLVQLGTRAHNSWCSLGPIPQLLVQLGTENYLFLSQHAPGVALCVPRCTTECSPQCETSQLRSNTESRMIENT